MGDKPVPNRYDPYQLKAKVDELLIGYLTKHKQLRVNNRYSNYKLSLGFIATLFCVVAHVYEYYYKPFPQDYTVLAVCVAGYFLFSFTYQYVDYWVSGDIFFTTCPSNAPLNVFAEVSLSSTIPRFSELYELTVFTKLKGSNKFESSVTKTSVGKLFTAEGRLIGDNATALVDQVLKQLA
jgi:hypothetical protein